MTKTILITGSTDGIGLLTAKKLAADGHTVLLHGRSEEKLAAAASAVGGNVETFCADLSNLINVRELAEAIIAKHQNLDVLINNAGVFKSPNSVTQEGFDLRIIVNTVAPYLLIKMLLPIIPKAGRVVNLSSAAQAPVQSNAFSKNVLLSDGEAYAQSKLALTMWSFDLANTLGEDAPAIVAVNPASFLGSKMVQEAYGMQGHDLSVGADILTRAALSDEFADASGRYFDNDHGSFANPHPDALDMNKNKKISETIETIIGQF